MKQQTTKKLSVPSIILTVLLVIFISVFAVSAYMLISYIVKGEIEKNRYDKNEELDKLSGILTPTEPTDITTTFTVYSYPTTSPEPTVTPSDSDYTSVPTSSVETELPSDSNIPDDSTPTDSTAATDTEITTTTPPVTEPPAPQYGERLTAVRNSIFELQKINPDIVGFISIPMLDIEYPLVSRRNDYTNSYYLNRAYDLSEATSGSIFYDFRCNPSPMSNRNTVLYGHNMRTGTMFGNLKAVLSSQDKLMNVDITIATLDGIYTFKFFSAYTTTATVNYCQTWFASDEDFDKFYTELKERSVYQVSYAPPKTPLILTLSTCTNITTEGRYAFHAVLTNIER